MGEQVFYTEGAGNSFYLYIGKEQSFLSLKDLASQKKEDPDGYILCAPQSDGLSFSFYNKDGSLVDFCGNALRATGLCYFSLFSEKEQVNLHTAVGALNILKVNEAEVCAQMPKPIKKQSLMIEGKSVEHVLAGVPHLVISIEAFGLEYADKQALRDFSQQVRKMNLEGLETYNLSFYKKEEEGRVSCVSFERGVEDFTEACGSGALSVACALNKTRLSLKMPGGLLEVFQESGKVFMQGPAKINSIYNL